jgi:hypothetical protein
VGGEERERSVSGLMHYDSFLDTKRHSGDTFGFKPVFMPSFLFDFQAALVEWSVTKGRSAILADCGLGKTPMQLVWAQNIVEYTNRPVLILTPLAVGAQTVAEGEKFHIQSERSRDGAWKAKAGIVVTNYEKLHLFSPTDFSGVVCDESSILKHFTGATQKEVTRFLTKVPYRLLCTATAAPNDYIELGTASEALGALGYSDMLTRFFTQSENIPHRRQEIKDWKAAQTGNHFAKLAYRVSQQIQQWRLKGHAEEHFWRWVCSWARACRQPSDLGFSNDRFILPAKVEREHLIEPKRPAEGMLFTIPAFGLKEERDERRRTLDERCEYVAGLVAHTDPAVIWCHLNAEGDRLESAITGSIQVKGSNSDEEKEEAYRAFQSGQISKLIIKPKIGAFGLNWQHCAHVVTFASHSYEQYYQAVRRCWRFGQARPVTVDIVATTGEAAVRENMVRKAEAAEKMFANLVEHMNRALHLERASDPIEKPEVPSWV